MTENELGEFRPNWVRSRTRRTSSTRAFTEAKCKHRIAQVEASASSATWRRRRRRSATRAGSGPSRCGRGTRSPCCANLQALDPAAATAPDQKLLLADPAAHSLATSGRRNWMVGYDAQTAVGAGRP